MPHDTKESPSLNDDISPEDDARLRRNLDAFFGIGQNPHRIFTWAPTAPSSDRPTRRRKS